METQEPLKWKPLEIEKVKRTKTITVVNRKVNNRVTENTDSEAGFSGSYFQFHPWLCGLNLLVTGEHSLLICAQGPSKD